MADTGTWAFDEDVALRFDREAHTHIPHYAEVIDKCLLIAKSAFPDPKAARIIDVGSATGYMLKRLRDAGFTEVYGVDNSAAMLAKSRVQENLIHSESFPIEHGPFDFVIANWTLHFIRDREAYLRSIRDSLNKGGILVISDKMDSTPFVHERYHDFKRSMDVTEEEIAAKAASIEGVLVPYPLEWYQSTLRSAGFSVIEIVDASWCFKTLLCKI